MKLVLADATYLKDSVSIISELVNEARFKISKDSVELVAMDPANVAMVIFKLLSSCFTEYDVPEPKEVALNLSNLKQILKRANASDILSLELLEDSKLKIQLKSDTIRTFSLPLIDVEEKEQRIPNLQFPITISLPSSVLTNVMDDVSIVAESVNFSVDNERFVVSAEGDLSKANIEINKSDDNIINSTTKANVKSKYSVEYLKKMVQGTKLADKVSVFFSQDYPLKLEYKVIDKLLLSFILAPRVESD